MGLRDASASKKMFDFNLQSSKNWTRRFHLLHCKVYTRQLLLDHCLFLFCWFCLFLCLFSFLCFPGFFTFSKCRIKSVMKYHERKCVKKRNPISRLWGRIMEQIRRLRLDSSCGSIKKATLHANRIRPSFSSGTRAGSVHGFHHLHWDLSLKAFGHSSLR